MLRRIFISIGYLLLTLFVVGLTVALVAYGKDYSYDFSTHKIVQKGHVIIRSVPNGLYVTADGKWLHKRTPYQQAYSVGAHTFSLAKDGFVTWQKTLQVVAGQVALAQYVILVPTHPAQTVFDSRQQITAQAMSRDHRHLAYITGGPESALYIMDVGNGKPVRLYAPKVASPATGVGAETLSGVVWSDDASHLLIGSTVDGQPVERLAAAGGGEPVNLTAQYGFSFAGAQFQSGESRILYWVAPDGLRRIDTGSQSPLGEVLADKVTQFWAVPGRVLYVQQTTLGRSLWSVDPRGRHQELVPALPESDVYSVAYSTYLNHDELTVVPAATQTGTLYTDIFGDTPVAKTIAHGVTGATFCPDGHLVAFTSANKISVYDLERSQINNSFVRYDITDQPGNLSALTWFDNFHLLLTRQAELYFSEFDGANRVDLGPVVSGKPAYGTAVPDARALVGFMAAGSTARITQLQIR